MERRNFLTVAGTAALLPRAGRAQQTAASVNSVRPEWLKQRKEAILEPALPIIDPHHHLWLRPGSRYLFEEFLQDANSGHNLIATVFVQCRSMYRTTGPEEMRPVGEVEFVTGVAAMSASGLFGKTKVAAGIVGQADLSLGSRVEPVLAEEVRAAGGRLRGIRHIAAWDEQAFLRNSSYPAPKGLLLDKKFREGFAALSRFGLTFETWIYHPQLPDLVDLARAFPGTRILVDHSGGPLGTGIYEGKRDEVFPVWSRSIKELAALPNVYMKIGGLGQSPEGFTFNREAVPPSSQILAGTFRPWVETCIQAFGASRCMFESNFPVDKVSYSYPVFWNTCKILARNAGAGEKADLFSGTATRFYGLTI